jgi:ATP-dependent protease ClpP protease subunit
MKTWGMADEDKYRDVPASVPLADLVSSQGSIKLVENTIYFYSEVDAVACGELNRLLREVDQRLTQVASIMQAEAFIPTIHLRINSYGGDVFAALSTIDTIRSLKSKVYTYIEGAAASAATIISVTGSKRYIGKNSFMLIHQLSSICSGTFERLQDEHENNKRIMTAIKSIYKEYTKIPMKEVDAILKRDLWFDSTTCLQHGLVDVIL